VEEEVMERKEGMFSNLYNLYYLKLNTISKIFNLYLKNCRSRFGGAGFGSRDYRTTSSMPPRGGSSGPPRRDYGGGSNNGN